MIADSFASKRNKNTSSKRPNHDELCLMTSSICNVRGILGSAILFNDELCLCCSKHIDFTMLLDDELAYMYYLPAKE